MKRLILMLAILLVASLPMTSAQEPTENTPAEGDNALSRSFQELGIRGGLAGLYGTNSTWVVLPHNWEITDDLTLELNYTASQAIISEDSTITVVVSGTPIHSFHPITDGQPVTEVMTVPPSAVDQGVGFTLSLQGFLRVTDSECEATRIPAQWVTINPESQISISYPSETLPPQLDQVVHELLPRNSFDAENEPLTFVVPNYADATAINVAAQIATLLGRETRGDDPIIEVRSHADATDQDLSNGSVVLIGTPDANQHLLTALQALNFSAYDGEHLLTLDGLPVPEGDGVLHILRSPWNPAFTALIVSGSGEDGLKTAGNAFASTAMLQSLSGSSQFISATAPTADSQVASLWSSETITFEQLGTSSRRVAGLGASSSFLYFQRPHGEVFGEGSQLTLAFAHSPLLEGSHVAVYIDNVFIGTVDTGPNGLGEYTFDLPIESLNAMQLEEPSGSMEVQLAVSNLIEVDPCAALDPDTVWTRLDGSNSYFTPNMIPLDLPDIGLFPFPFAGNASQTPVAVVVPDEPTNEDMQMALSLISRMGDYARQDVPVQILASDDIPNDLYANHVIVLEGVSSDPPLESEHIVYQSLEAADIGIVRESLSPFGAGRMLLTVTGNSPKGYKMAADILLYGAGSSELEDVELVEESADLVVVRDSTPD